MAYAGNSGIFSNSEITTCANEWVRNARSKRTVGFMATRCAAPPSPRAASIAARACLFLALASFFADVVVPLVVVIPGTLNSIQLEKAKLKQTEDVTKETVYEIGRLLRASWE